MPKKGGNISLSSYDDIFQTDQSREEDQQERVQEIPLSELHPFKGHPFKVLDDEAMQKTVESIAQFGVMTPAIARPRPEGGYELIAGHRRHHASELAGKETMPVIVRDMDDDAATILMVDSNLQRETLLPSERAFAYKMKLEAIKHQGQRTDLTSSQVGMKLQAMDIVGQEAGDSRNQVHRYIRLTELIPELLDGEYSDYTRKGGVICSDILLPSHAPKEYADRQTLWNAVEKAERGKTAQLAYSFDIALQNEFSLEENIALARQFLLEQFVSRGMVVDFAVHQPDREDGGIPNPHFHVLCPIRPIEQNGKWGLKQRRVYELDEDGNRIRDQNGEFVFNAVPTTDWGSPETLEHWREAWAELCNAKFAEKGIDVRIDHRSYERQGVELLPTVHEGATVRAMEKKGIRTEKGEFNRWIKATNTTL